MEWPLYSSVICLNYTLKYQTISLPVWFSCRYEENAYTQKMKRDTTTPRVTIQHTHITLFWLFHLDAHKFLSLTEVIAAFKDKTTGKRMRIVAAHLSAAPPRSDATLRTLFPLESAPTTDPLTDGFRHTGLWQADHVSSPRRMSSRGGRSQSVDLTWDENRGELNDSDSLTVPITIILMKTCLEMQFWYTTAFSISSYCMEIITYFNRADIKTNRKYI